MSDPALEINNEDVAQITILVRTDEVADDLPEKIEHLICPGEGDDHDCALLAMSRHPLHDPEKRVVVPIHGNPEALHSVRRRLITQAAAHEAQTDKFMETSRAEQEDPLHMAAVLGHTMAAHYANVLSAVLRIAKERGLDGDDLALDVVMMLADGDLAADHNDDMAVE